MVVIFDIIIDQFHIGLLQNQNTAPFVLQNIVMLNDGLRSAADYAIKVLENLISSDKAVFAVDNIDSFRIAA